MAELAISNTIGVVAQCVSEAEQAVRDLVSDTVPNADEETVTHHFEARLAHELRTATNNLLFETAFATDLSNAFPDADYSSLVSCASGLVAQVAWHGKKKEGVTGGDFGLVLARPEAEDDLDPSIVRITRNVRRGILVQAKKGYVNGKTGKLTPNQRTNYSSFRPHGSICLYRFEDVRTLLPFQWQVSRRRNLATIEKWLAECQLDDPMSSSQLIERLGAGVIGTNNPKVIGQKIAPEDQRTLVICIDWPNSGPPQFEVVVTATPEEQRQLVQICVTDG